MGKVSSMLHASFKCVSRKFQESFMGVLREVSKKLSRWLKEVFELFRWSFHGVFRKFQGCCKKFSMWKFKGCVGSISRVFKKNFRGCFRSVIRVLEATTKGVCQRSYRSVWNFRDVLGKFHGWHREISRVFPECFIGDSSLLSQFQGEF